MTNILGLHIITTFCPRCHKRSDAPTKTQNYHALCNACCGRYLRMKKHPFKAHILKVCGQQLAEIKAEKAQIDYERNGGDSV